MTTDVAVGRARDLFEQRAWGEAYEALRAAGTGLELAAVDLERLAVAAYLTGRDDEACETWARAHRAYVRAEHGLAAVRCANFHKGCCATRASRAGRTVSPPCCHWHKPQDAARLADWVSTP